MKESTCRGCGEPIIWTITAKGKKMCVDFEPIHLIDGQLGFTLREAETVRAREGTVYADAVRGGKGFGGRAYIAHFITCVEANSFRKKPRD